MRGPLKSRLSGWECLDLDDRRARRNHCDLFGHDFHLEQDTGPHETLARASDIIREENERQVCMYMYTRS